ncbi:hypothetical protein NFI96_009218 [Prochilodus magdalenae]|nr:hypothetical protein NFI96_009218 [Prochilodus magdalenae]
MVKKAQQRLYFLRSLKKAHLCPRILVDFYRCTTESILTNCISVWYGSCSASDRKALQRVVKTAQRITGTQLPTIESVYQKRCLTGREASSLRESFLPEAVTLLNSTPSQLELVSQCFSTATERSSRLQPHSAPEPEAVAWDEASGAAASTPRYMKAVGRS